MKDKLNIMIKWTIVFLLYFIILPIIFSSLFRNLIHSKNNMVANISLALTEIITFLILFYIYRQDIIKDIKKFKTDYRKNLDTGFKYYLIGLLVMVVSNLVISFLIGDGAIATNEDLNRKYLQMYPLYSIIAMVLVGPPIEEIVFRLGFRKAFKKEIIYCLFSAFVFGGLHVYTAFDGMTMAQILKNWMQVLYIIPYGSLGFAFAKCYFNTDNICTSAVIHMIHNGITILLIFSIL